MRSSLLGAMVVAGCAAGTTAGQTPVADGGGFIPIVDSGVGITCRGNRDGVIERSEVVFVPGVQVRYRINPVATLARVAPAGTANADGTRTWDFSDTSGDTVTLTLGTSAGQWWQAQFPTAQYAAPIDPRAANLGVYSATDRVQLLGVVGPAQSDGTVVPYDPPVDVLQFPLRAGATWTMDSTTRGAMIANTPVASRDHYVFTVDARGVVRLPELTFNDALRLRVELTQQFPAGPGTRKIQYLWMTECYGEVARMTSQDGEVDPAFALASEFRRLGL